MFNEDAVRIAGTSDGVEANRAEIARAFELAEARKNAAQNAGAVAAMLAANRRLREPQIPSPHETLKTILVEALGRWDRTPVTSQSYSAGRPAHTYARARSVAAITLLGEALAALGDRAGDRAAAVRVELTAQRAVIAAAVEHYDSLADLTGPLAQDLITRIAAVRAASTAAWTAKEHATRDTVEAALLEIEKVAAEARQLDRDIAQALAGLQVPELPSENDFRDAKLNSEDLERQPGKRPRAELVARAIDAGTNTPLSVARLFVAYESPGAEQTHELVKWRARALAER
jgi:hypothetical protein